MQVERFPNALESSTDSGADEVNGIAATDFLDEAITAMADKLPGLSESFAMLATAQAMTRIADVAEDMLMLANESVNINRQALECQHESLSILRRAYAPAPEPEEESKPVQDEEITHEEFANTVKSFFDDLLSAAAQSSHNHVPPHIRQAISDPEPTDFQKALRDVAERAQRRNELINRLANEFGLAREELNMAPLPVLEKVLSIAQTVKDAGGTLEILLKRV